MSDFYEIIDDLDATDRWFLTLPKCAHGEHFDARTLTRAREVTISCDLVCEVRRAGRPLDFTIADFDVPILSPRVVQVLRTHGVRLQTAPVTLLDPSPVALELVNFLAAADCMDEDRSVFDRWTAAHGRPDKIGKYRVVTRMVLDRSRIPAEPLFRVRGWELAVVASSALVGALSNVGVTGIRFRPLALTDAN